MRVGSAFAAAVTLGYVPTSIRSKLVETFLMLSEPALVSLSAHNRVKHQQ